MKSALWLCRKITEIPAQAFIELHYYESSSDRPSSEEKNPPGLAIHRRSVDVDRDGHLCPDIG
jgi:hypothetical protein